MTGSLSIPHAGLKLTAVFETAPEGGFTCFFEELPEVFSEGETIAEAERNLFDALDLVMSHHRDEARKGGSPADVVRHEFQFALA